MVRIHELRFTKLKLRITYADEDAAGQDPGGVVGGWPSVEVSNPPPARLASSCRSFPRIHAGIPLRT
jgi:hypothetical protein